MRLRNEGRKLTYFEFRAIIATHKKALLLARLYTDNIFLSTRSVLSN